MGMRKGGLVWAGWRAGTDRHRGQAARYRGGGRAGAKKRGGGVHVITRWETPRYGVWRYITVPGECILGSTHCNWDVGSYRLLAAEFR